MPILTLEIVHELKQGAKMPGGGDSDCRVTAVLHHFRGNSEVSGEMAMKNIGRETYWGGGLG
jgi:hypothetical protein